MTWGTSCRRKRKRVATPTLPPPPRTAQNSSGSRLGVDDADGAVGRDQFDGEQRIDGQAEAPDEVPDATAEGQPGDADRARVPEPGGQTVLADGRGVGGGGHAGPSPRRATHDIDVDGVEVAHVDDQAAGHGRVARAAMAATAHGDLDTGVPRRGDGQGHILGAARTDDEAGPLVDGTGDHDPHLVVVGVVGGHDAAIEARAQGIQVDGGGVRSGGHARVSCARSDGRSVVGGVGAQPGCGSPWGRGAPRPGAAVSVSSPASRVLARRRVTQRHEDHDGHDEGEDEADERGRDHAPDEGGLGHLQEHGRLAGRQGGGGRHRATERVDGSIGRGLRDVGRQRAGDLTAIQGHTDAAQDGDAQRPAELARRSPRCRWRPRPARAVPSPR